MATPEPRDRAFERLYRRYVQDVYRYALAVLRNPADAEDVTQTTFMNAYRAMQRGEEPRTPQHWLISIAHNACRTRAIRASRRPREVPLDVSVGELPLPEQERPNVHAVLRALGRLPFNQRAALVMRELEGRSYEEIADTLGVTVPAVETLIFRARRSLRLRRDALLRGLVAVPLPASLQTFVDGGTAATTGGVALGGGVVAKAAAVIAALIAGTAGYEAVGVATPHHPARPAASAGVLPVELAVAKFARPGDSAQVRAPAQSVEKSAAPPRTQRRRGHGRPTAAGSADAVAGAVRPARIPRSREASRPAARPATETVEASSAPAPQAAPTTSAANATSAPRPRRRLVRRVVTAPAAAPVTAPVTAAVAAVTSSVASVSVPVPPVAAPPLPPASVPARTNQPPPVEVPPLPSPPSAPAVTLPTVPALP